MGIAARKRWSAANRDEECFACGKMAGIHKKCEICDIFVCKYDPGSFVKFDSMIVCRDCLCEHARAVSGDNDTLSFRRGFMAMVELLSDPDKEIKADP